MKQGSKVGIVCCSNGLSADQAGTIEILMQILEKAGLEAELSPYLYGDETGRAGTARERAGALMKFYEDDSIEEIFDVSGGDMANELLPYLDFQAIAYGKKRFWGYSDLTTILNAIYAKAGKEAVLYQIRNLLYRHSEVQRRDFINTLQKNGNDLYDLNYHFIQGTAMEGVMIGGNIRCFLKLAGTEYMPDLHDKILLLEALNTGVPQLITFLSQLKQLHAFEYVNGILLGTFTKMEKEQVQPDAVTLVREFAGPELPIAKTAYIGHGSDSKGAVIGRYYRF